MLRPYMPIFPFKFKFLTVKANTYSASRLEIDGLRVSNHPLDDSPYPL